MLKLYESAPSMNCYKIRLLLAHLNRPVERIEVDILKGATRTPEFLAMTPIGRIPLLVTEDGNTLPESGAILFYLAKGTPFLPEDAFWEAQILQWMFFEQNLHEPNVATARAILKVFKTADTMPEVLADKQRRGHDALSVMERHLTGHPFFVGGRFTIADINLYAYTHVAHEGGFNLEEYPNIRAWIGRIEAVPGHILAAE